MNKKQIMIGKGINSQKAKRVEKGRELNALKSGQTKPKAQKKYA